MQIILQVIDKIQGGDYKWQMIPNPVGHPQNQRNIRVRFLT